MIKGFLLKGRRGRKRTWEEREGWEGKGKEGDQGGGILLQGLREDRRPWLYRIISLPMTLNDLHRLFSNEINVSR